MKRWVFIIFAILAQIVLVSRICESGVSYTQTFRMSVQIPAVIGLNVPDPNKAEEAKLAPPLITKDTVTSNTLTDIILSQGRRGNQNITYKTLVVR